MGWQFNSSYGHIHMLGWLLVLGNWSWGRVVTWMIEESPYQSHQGIFAWVSVLWEYAHDTEQWTHTQVGYPIYLCPEERIHLDEWLIHTWMADHSGFHWEENDNPYEWPARPLHRSFYG